MSADQKQFIDQINQRIFPLMQEAGVDGCVITGYFTGAEGRQGKFNLLLARHSQVALVDALVPLARFGSMWCAPSAEFSPPSVPPIPGSGVDGAPA